MGKIFLFFASLAFSLAAEASSDVIAISCGNAASAGAFVADTDYAGGSVYGVTNAIDTSKVLNAAPQGVYENTRYGNFTYTIPNLVPGAPYLVRLHFAEIYFNSAGQRTFNVTINNNTVLQNFDIFAAAGGEFIANVQQFAVPADATGKIAIQFTNVITNAQVNGIEIAQISAPPSPNYNLSLSSDKLTYVAGNRATVLVSLQNAPVNPDYDLFVSATFNGAPIGLTRVAEGELYAVTPALASGVGLFIATAYLENKSQAAALGASIRYYQGDIAQLSAELGATSDPAQQAVLQAKIAHDQDRLASAQAALQAGRKQIGLPVNLNIYTF